MTEDRLCSHCLLTIGPRAMRRTVNGEICAFCCYGCCIAFQVKSGKSEEWEAAWLLIRLGVGGFLSMNIMLFSLLLYTGAFTGVDARLLPWVHLLLWIFATPALIILGGPFLRESWLDGVQGRLRSSALIVVGVGAAYIYSAFAVIERGTPVYFDEAAITGESRQVAKRVGSPVIAGSINLDGPLLIQSSGAGTATRWAQICRSVREALLRRSPSQRLADRIV